ncbi:hypothetical protein Tco_0199044 [Tanacetum coccineum]
MTTTVVNNYVFRAFFEKQRLTGPNFIDWYRNLQIVLLVEDKLPFLEQPIPVMPIPPARQVLPPDVLATHSAWVKASKEIASVMLMTMDPNIQKNLEQLGAYDMLKELKTFYIDNLERLGHAMTQNLAVSLILVSLRKEYNSFVQNYNMHDMGKTVTELHAMLKLHEQTLSKKEVAPALHAIRAGKPKIPPPPNKDNPAKDAICHQCGDVGDSKRNCPQYLAELLKNKKLSQGASTSGIFTIELYTFPNNTWVYDTGCGTHICITAQGLRGSRKLKPGALSMYVGDGHRAAVEAIGSYHLCLPSVLNTEFLENSLITQEASRSLEDLEIIQVEDMHPSVNTSLHHDEDDQEIDKPQSDIIPIRRSTRIRHVPDHMCLYVDAEEHESGDLNEPDNNKAALSDPESEK